MHHVSNFREKLDLRFWMASPGIRGSSSSGIFQLCFFVTYDGMCLSTPYSPLIIPVVSQIMFQVIESFTGYYGVWANFTDIFSFTGYYGVWANFIDMYMHKQRKKINYTMLVDVLLRKYVALPKYLDIVIIKTTIGRNGRAEPPMVIQQDTGWTGYDIISIHVNCGIPLETILKMHWC